MRDTWLVLLRAARPTLRNPVVIVVGLLQPLLFLLLFGPLLGGSGSWQWFVPGLIIQMGLFGTAYAGFALIPEIRSGALERMRVTPVSRVALLLGRVLHDVALLVVQCALLLAMATLFGFRASLGHVLAGLAFAVLIGVAIGSASYTLALKLKHEYAFAPVLSATVMPLMLLSGVLLPMDQGPGWLYTISRINPFSHVADGVRAVIAGNFDSSSVLTGGIAAVALAAAGLAWGTWSFVRANA
ncbi:ABC transporter permease [Kibdelosporangium phytohabitans]|uniref:Transport permease protein n=1 Tax=Kibdelosporangium phytohabitans TaxID=860235 RepID=A0A0N9HT25_9PSEU|nr:ABC transporter permease [Kibdelosporangium phytohabitans]ALG06494.1 multidrug ABC transporter permease [Kibdelosporangium phytohabitans]MBE1467669.1 ABC-2 type transport system permease protein [Kibdelosporangium phytohabitans]